MPAKVKPSGRNPEPRLPSPQVQCFSQVTVSCEFETFGFPILPTPAQIENLISRWWQIANSFAPGRFTCIYIWQMANSTVEVLHLHLAVL